MTVPDGEYLARLNLQLAEAKLAKHRIAMGKQLITLSYSAEGSHTQQFSPANLAALDQHIAQLTAEIAQLTGIGRRRAFTIC